MMLLLLAALQAVPQLPDTSGWGVHVLSVARAPDSAIWVGTYGRGIYVLRTGAGSWEQIRASDDTAAHAISWDFVHAFGFGPRGQIWYGTVGNGWGLSTDGGKTWKNWEFRQLGPEWQYVTPDGIIVRGDTTYIATADGIKVTWDDGATWRVITDSAGATTAKDSVWRRIPNQYVLALLAADTAMTIVAPGGLATPAKRRLLAEASERPPTHLCSDPKVVVPTVTLAGDSLRGTPWGLLRAGEPWGCATLPRAGALVSGRVARPAAPKHTWFRRPIALTDQPYIDQTYRFGSTMGGNFQPHQGVEFNNGNGTPVHAIGDGVVVHAGPAERGALTVAIKHDRRLQAAPGRRPGVSRDASGSTDAGAAPRGGYYLFSVYYHNSRLLVTPGQRVKAGDVIALVGNTGRATNDHMHLEVHAAPFDSTRLIVDPAVRYPPYNTNTELWIDPLPGTGLIAGQVWDSAGQPVPQARIYGLVKPDPRETPFSFIETYGPRNHQDPVYHEHFAISDVPPGEYVLGVAIGGTRVFRRVQVAAGKMTWVEFRP